MDKDGHCFFYVRHNNLIFLAISKKDSNALTVFQFLHKLIGNKNFGFLKNLLHNYIS